MKRSSRILQICLTAILLLSGCQVERTGTKGQLPEPPRPKIAWNGKTAEVLLTSYCWSYGKKGRCVDTPGPVTIIERWNPHPLQVTPGAVITLSYELPPDENSIMLSQWMDGDPVEQALDEDGRWTAPEQPGWYMYEVRARWPQGDAGHAFVIEVRNSE